MLKKLDYFIIQKYFSTFLFTALIFSMISLTIDVSERIERFISKKLTLQQIVGDYYLGFLLNINGLLLPMFALIAVIFFTSRMASNSEILSILGAGVSYRRLMLPYSIAGGILMIVHLIGNHWIIPVRNKARITFENTYIYDNNDKGRVNDVHLFTSPDTKIFVSYYSKKDTNATDLRIERFENQELVYMLKARSAEWKGEPNKWRLFDYEVRTFKGNKETLRVGNTAQLDTTLSLRPDDFVRFINQKERMTTAELRAAISAEQTRGLASPRAYQVEIARRTADPFTVMILTFIGLAVAGRKVRGGMGLHLTIGISLGALFIFMSKFSASFATSATIPIIVAVWIPNMIFMVVAAYLIANAQR
jgi:lipopolysaccharide export system permease protein